MKGLHRFDLHVHVWCYIPLKCTGDLIALYDTYSIKSGLGKSVELHRRTFR